MIILVQSTPRYRQIKESESVRELPLAPHPLAQNAKTTIILPIRTKLVVHMDLTIME